MSTSVHPDAVWCSDERTPTDIGADEPEIVGVLAVHGEHGVRQIAAEHRPLDGGGGVVAAIAREQQQEDHREETKAVRLTRSIVRP